MPAFLPPVSPVRIGPYTLAVCPVPRALLPDRRRRSGTDYARGLVLLDETLEAGAALRHLFTRLVAAIHYRAGLDDKCSEEAFTHSLATGLVEVARGSPEFWCELHEMVDAVLGARTGFAPVAAGQVAAGRFAAPVRVVCGRRSARIVRIPARVADRERAYGFYTAREDLIEIADSLEGAQLAVVVLHELLHFLHDCEGLTDKTPERGFIDAQARLLAAFLRHNPTAWRWLLATLADAPRVAELRRAA